MLQISVPIQTPWHRVKSAEQVTSPNQGGLLSTQTFADQVLFLPLILVREPFTIGQLCRRGVADGQVESRFVTYRASYRRRLVDGEVRSRCVSRRTSWQWCQRHVVTGGRPRGWALRQWSRREAETSARLPSRRHRWISATRVDDVQKCFANEASANCPW